MPNKYPTKFFKQDRFKLSNCVIQGIVARSLTDATCETLTNNKVDFTRFEDSIMVEGSLDLIKLKEMLAEKPERLLTKVRMNRRTYSRLRSATFALRWCVSAKPADAAPYRLDGIAIHIDDTLSDDDIRKFDQHGELMP